MSGAINTQSVGKRGFKASRLKRQRQFGAAIAELVVVLPALLALGLGVLQSALFYQAKTTVSYATFEAARKGATTHAQKLPMLEEFGMRISPIFGGDGTDEKALNAINEAKGEALNPLLTTIDIINPTREAFLEFGVNGPNGQLEIPNTHLKYRDPSIIGAESGVNIQDANLLKIQTTYGFELKVPFIAQAVTAVMKQFDASNAKFYDQGRIPITAVATVRMQSAAWEDGNLHVDGSKPGNGQVPGADSGEADTHEGDADTDGGEQTGDGSGTGEEGDSDADGANNPNPNEVECESNWDDERYQSLECDRWYCELQVFTSELKAAANVIWDFLEGFIAGIGDQVSDLWELAKDPGVLLDVAQAFIDDPRGTLEAIVESIAEDIEKVSECGPKDIGRIAGQNVNPATPLRVLSKLADVSKNAKLADYVKRKELDIDCASFPGKTPVWTPEGNRSIENLGEGQYILSRDQYSFLDEPRRIAQLLSRTALGVHKITTELGEVQLTAEHPVWVQGKGWIGAEDIEWEDALATVNGDAIAYENEYIHGPVKVYNFTVDTTPNYFAGKMGLWVHNAGPCYLPTRQSPSGYRLGASDGGPGHWSDTGNGTGNTTPTQEKAYKYQEQVTGAPRGREYNVNGVNFDGYDASTDTLIDAKRYTDNCPLADCKPDFLKESVRSKLLAEAESQVAAADGKAIEWYVSDPDSADKIADILGSNPNTGSIKVVYVPDAVN